jgi:uncharacterized membrane protein
VGGSCRAAPLVVPSSAAAHRSHLESDFMMNPFWLVWLVFLFMFLVAPVGYGWGYRGWGAPYPRYMQQRRAQRAGALGSSFNHHAWGRSGDFIWLGIIVAILWACVVMFLIR